MSGQRPQTWHECWRYARDVGYPRTARGWVRAYRDLVRAAHLPWGVRRSTTAELLAERIT